MLKQLSCWFDLRLCVVILYRITESTVFWGVLGVENKRRASPKCCPFQLVLLQILVLINH